MKKLGHYIVGWCIPSIGYSFWVPRDSKMARNKDSIHDDDDDDELMSHLRNHFGADGALDDPYGQSVQEAVTPEVTILLSVGSVFSNSAADSYKEVLPT